MPCRKIVYFHGVTPVDLLLDQDPVAAYWSSKALLQVPQLMRCDTLIANSHWNLEDLLKHFEQRPGSERLDVIPPITPDLPIFRESLREQPKGDPFEVIVVGRVAPHKKIEWAIEMIAQLGNKGLNAHLRIIGSSHNGHYLSLLRATSERLHLQNRVHFDGQVSQADLINAFRHASALLVTSEHEGFCIPVLEAMHMGLPALVRTGTAASEVGGDAVAGFTTVAEGVEALQRLIQEPGLRDAMVKSGRRKAAEWLEHASPGNWLKQLSTD
ncbi:glycosyltransferase [Hydrogenophaga sp. PAMC20947]|uniref:glycosyltransferase n=1 Tax=Hydrogenophaga sp. PAMC20947 TaxID=2565558 RepID=UPI001B348EBD|nr:glycosyltransferase [Hydrogenophaga sp. PAMC20947]